MTFPTRVRPSALLVGVLAALFVPAPALGQESEKPRIAVVQFENNSTSRWHGPRLGRAGADELTTQLVQSGEFTVVERDRLQALMAEQKLGQSGAVDPSTAAKIGQLLGVQGIVTGSITQFSVEEKGGGIGPVQASFAEAETKIDIRVVDTSTGEILLAAEGGGKKRFGGAVIENVNFEREFDAGLAQEALRPAVEKTVEKIVQLKPKLASIKPSAPPGEIVGANEDRYYINRGENFGVEVGQRFDVYRVVDEIRNSDGELLDTVTEKVGTLSVTRVLSESSICEVVSGEAQEGDEVRPAGGS